MLGKESRRFACCRKCTSPFFFPEEVSILTDFKNAAAAANKNDFFFRSVLDLCRHTVGFRAIVSLLAIFNFDCHATTMPDLGSVCHAEACKTEGKSRRIGQDL